MKCKAKGDVIAIKIEDEIFNVIKWRVKKFEKILVYIKENMIECILTIWDRKIIS